MTWRSAILDSLGVAGIGLIAVGLWWIYPPLSFVVVGAILLGLAVAGATKAEK